MNETALQEELMAKKAGRPKNPDKGKPVRIHPDVHRMAQRVADYRGLALSDFLSDLSRANVIREFQKMNAEIDAKAQEKEKRK